MELVDFLRRLPPLAGIDPAGLHQLVQSGRQHSLAAGATLIAEGRPADATYILLSGELEELESGRTVRRFGAGEAVGLRALFVSTPSPTALRARVACTLLVVAHETMRELAARVPGLGLAVARQLALRAQVTPPPPGPGSIDLSRYAFDAEAHGLFPERLLAQHRAVPLHRQGDSLTIALVDPHDRAALDDLRRVAGGLLLEPLATSAASYRAFVQRHQRARLAKRSVVRRAPAAISHVAPRTRSDTGALSGQEVIDFVDDVLREALVIGASDIHFETRPDRFEIRFRVDGRLRSRDESAKPELSPAVIARIKVLARMDISEHRLPLDGRFGILFGSDKIEFRVSTVPSVHGEKAVLRVLDAQMLSTGLDNLILAALVRDVVQTMVRQPYGLILVTGPTSSGKTTTLYSIINEMDRKTRNIVTVEDPVEYALPDITQTQIQVKNTLGFPQMVRALLRQNPDVILVGEIRDAVSARASAEAAMTGHLVLTSLHANDAVSSVVRLRELEVEPSVLANSLVGVINQRLVRRICPSCRVEQPLRSEARKQIQSALGDDVQLSQAFTGKGCGACLGSGFSGRVAVFETLPVAGALRDALVQRVTPQELRRAARASGLIPRRAYAGFLINRGLSTAGEVLKTLAD